MATQTFQLDGEHGLGVTTVSRAEMILALEYLQPLPGSGLAAVIAAWADSSPGVVAKTGANTSTAITYPELRKNIEDNGNYQTLVGNGTVTSAPHITYLSATTGSYLLDMEVGSYDGQEKIIILADNITDAEFTLSAAFFDWNKLIFKRGSRSAVLRWVGGSVNRWLMVGGNAEGV